MDRISIILGLSLLIASFCSYFVVEAFAQPVLFEFDCPENAYHGLDNQGNEACRDILTNKILGPESSIVIDSNSEKTKSDFWRSNNPETGEISFNGEPQTAEIIILALIGIVGSIIGVSAKKGKLKIYQRRGWNSIQKEQVRDRQYGRCNMCFTQPTQWKYDYTDENKSNNELNNCQGLCPHCYSIKTEKNNQIFNKNLLNNN